MKPIICLSLLTAALLPVTTFAADTTWINPTSGSWFTPENWSDATVPSGVEIAHIEDGTSVVDASMGRAGTLVLAGAGKLTILDNSSLLVDSAFVIQDSTLPGPAVTVSGYSVDDDIGLSSEIFLVGLQGTGKLLINGNGAVYANGGDFMSPETLATIGGAPGGGVIPTSGAGTGEVTVTGSNAYFGAANFLFVGAHDGTGTLNVLDGATAEVREGGVASVLVIAAGEGTEAVGNVTVSGAGSHLSAADIFMAVNADSGPEAAGTGTLTVDAGGTVSARHVTLGPFDLGGDLTGAGHIILNGTELGGRGKLFVDDGLAANRGTIDFDGGVLEFGTGNAQPLLGFGPGDITLGAGGGFFAIAADDVELTSPIDGVGMFHKTGDGTMKLGATNFFTGGVTVEGGNLIAGADSALPSAGPYVVNGGTLDLGGHLLHVSSLSGAGGAIDIDGNFIVEQDSADTTFSGVIRSDGPAEFYKMGGKQLTLSGGMPEGGNIQISVQGGELVFNSTSSLQGLHVGNLGTTGALTIAEGSLTASQYLTVGEDLDSTGTLTIGPAGTLTIGNGAALTVGYSNGAGTLNILPDGTLEVGGANGLATSGALSTTVNFGGTIQVVNSNLTTSVPMTLTTTATVDTNGYAATFSGVLSGAASGGLVKIGEGTLTLTGANTYSNSGPFEPQTVVRQGTLSVDGGSITHPDAAIFIGHHATDVGALEIKNGATVSNAYAYLGVDGSSTGSAAVTGTGSSWTSAGSLSVGYLGAGTLTVSNGGHVTSNGAYIAYDSGSTGTATVTGAGSQWQNTGEFYVGNTDPGTLTIADGGTVIVDGGTGTVNVAHYGASTGTINIGDYNTPTTAGTLSAASVVFGDGTGVINFNQNNNIAFGAVISGGGSVVQRTSDGAETALTAANTYSGGTTITSAGIVALHNSALGTGAVTLDGGQLRAGPDITLANAISVGAGGGEINNYGAYARSTFTGPIALGGILTIAAYSDAPASVTITGGITGIGDVHFANGDQASIMVSGAAINPTGAILHDGSSHFSTTISAPIDSNVTGIIQNSATSPLILDGLNSYAGTTTVSAGTLIVNGSIGGTTTVSAAGTLGGIGTLGDVVVSGTLAPGNSIGTLSATSLTWNADAHFVFELGASSSDLLHLSGAFTKGGAGSYTFDFADAGAQAGHTYILVDFGSTDFTDSDFGFASNFGGFNGTFAFNGTTLEFNLVAIPEPSTYAFGIAILLAVLIGGRRRKRSRVVG